MKDLALFALSVCGAIASGVWVNAAGHTPDASGSDALFDPSRVIQIEIRVDPRDWHALRISHPILEDENNISITEQGYAYYRGDAVIDGQVIKSVGIRKKGAWGSLSSQRPSLKIKFDEYLKNRKFSELDMLTLNNCLSDPTKARQFLAYSFMRKAGVPAPRSNLARVRVNGEDLGIYANVESIRKPFIERHFTNANGDLYEPQNGADFATNVTPRIGHKWGRDEKAAHVEKLVEVLARPGPVSLRSIEESLDLDAFITYWAAEVLIGFGDGYSANQNNYYLYRDATPARFFFIPWGVDTPFVDAGTRGRAVPKSVKATAYLCERLWQLPDIQERHRREMRRLLAEVWDEKTMLLELSRIRELCRDDLPEDPTKFGRRFSPPTVEQSVDRLVQFIEGRRKEVQAELDGPAPVWPEIPRWSGLPPRPDTNAPMHVEGSFSAVIAPTFPPGFTNLLGQGAAEIEFSVDGQKHKPFSRFGAMAITKAGDRDLTIVRVVATDSNDQQRWNIVFSIDPYRMTTGALELKKWEVEASLDQKNPTLKKAQWRNPAGTLELMQLSTSLGGMISGKFKFNTTAFEEEKKP